MGEEVKGEGKVGFCPFCGSSAPKSFGEAVHGRFVFFCAVCGRHFLAEDVTGKVRVSLED